MKRPSLFLIYALFTLLLQPSTCQGVNRVLDMVNVYYVKVFSENPAFGNLAGVVPYAETLDVPTMQSIAKKVGASETVFILPSKKADLQLRWFTPNTEVGLCIHATIAALATVTKLQELHKDKVSIETKNTILQAQLVKGEWFVYIDNYKTIDTSIDSKILKDYLGIEEQDLFSPPGIVQVFDDYELIVPVKSLTLLENLHPDITQYATLCKELNITGISIVTTETFDKGNQFHTREFAPLYGYLEDPLCGMAAGALISYFGIRENDQLIQIEQGNFLSLPGIIKVLPSNSGLWIGGASVVYQLISTGAN